MENKLSEKEIQFIRRLQPKRFKLRYVFFVPIALLVALLVAGWLYDPIMAYQLLKNSNNIWGWLLGSLFLGIIGFIGEGIFNWIESKDGVAHPLYLRFFHLIMVIGLGSLICLLLWVFLTYSNLFKI